MNGRIHIEEGSVQETLIIPLYGRKLCAEVFPALYNDEGAKEICERLDYDFTGLDHQANSTFWRFGALEVAMRQLDMQWEIRDYLKGHPLACVVNMGCGLDQTGSAADNGTCNIVNVDMPDIIAARRELVPTGARERSVAADLRDLAWLDEVCGSHGAIFFAAGVFHYLTETEVRTLVRAIGERFGGARLVFDAVGRLGRRLMRASFKSFGMQNYDECLCVDDPEALRAWCPGATLTYRGYMLGYQRMVDPAVTHLHRMLARVCDGPVKMRIFRFDFCE